MINTNNDVIHTENWSKYDFLVNKHYWLKQGFESALSIRIRNLKDLTKSLTSENIRYWLQGKTLLGLYKENQFLDDHDDDISIWKEDKDNFKNNVLPNLLDKGFQVIRDNDQMISVCRDYRYIDICIFKQERREVGYGQKWFPKHLFEDFECIEIYGEEFFVPKETDRLLEIMYNPNLINRIRNFLRRLKTSNPRNYKNKVQELAIRVCFKLPHSLRQITNIPFRFLGVHYKQLDEEEFLNLNIEPMDSFNWKWRKPHLDIFTDGGKYTKIKDIVSYLKSKNTLHKIVKDINETDMTEEFYEPVNLDQNFWQSGNNYFLYCILFEYKKGVTPYHLANKYIEEVKFPKLYTKDYYESLSDMSEKEIIEMFKKDPIETTNGAVTSGKHRVCAMMGRNISGKHYLPIWAVCKT
ncbi:hypothetical protein DYD21_07045 [Rhodohalobacter sp. SW132]|uniref:hypothetical protein n=1 Tax=Rhodohalobacter sp. SW132 TaxID=2293433 RepID=UPI000E22B478|nr:hypothetical protein [Rhodohalobacter sp. SW132]REL37541.1 hypothetical protein DYD21_07045 [Rhodohalobacter sp. SW132]